MEKEIPKERVAKLIPKGRIPKGDHKGIDPKGETPKGKDSKGGMSLAPVGKKIEIDRGNYSSPTARAKRWGLVRCRNEYEYER